MESRETIMPKVEPRAPEVPPPPSNYQLALKTESSSAQAGNPPPPQMVGPLGFSPMPVSGGVLSSSLEKKKRGRPRKYGPDGVAVSGRTLSPMPLSSTTSPTSGGYSDMKFGEAGGSGAEKEKKRRRMKSSEKLNLSLGDQITSGGSFTPHMVTVNPGEDVTSKIISFSKYGPRAICVLSALGIISHVTLRQANSSGGTVTYEGRFEILSLSGSFTPGEHDGMTSREGGMSIALSSPDGRVVGGLLGGLLTAAGPVQVVVASFLPDGANSVEPKPRKQKNVIRDLIPVEDSTIHRATNVEQQNFNEETEESPSTENTISAPARNFEHESRATMPTMHDWRRGPTDMNVSLRED